MVQLYFDIWTTVLYVLVGIVGYYLIKNIMRGNTSRISRYTQNRDNFCNFYIVLFIFIFALFAALRHVGYRIGGADALAYIEMFQYCLIYDVADRAVGTTTIESGFIMVNKAIRFFTDNWRIYFFIAYGFIAFSYIYFIKRMCPKAMVFIPMVLLAFLYVKGFNTLRSHMAISVFLIGLSFIKDRKWLCLLIIASSVLFHRMSILYVPIWLFYFLFKKYMTNMNKLKYFVIGVIGLVFSFLIARYLQNYIIAFNLLDSGTDMGYLSRSLGVNILESYPMYFAHIALFISLYFFYDKVYESEKGLTLMILFIYDLWIVPAALVLGMWRFVNYLFVLRLCLWSIILFYLCKEKRRSFYKGLAWVLFIFWFVFRFSREYDDTCTSPYILDLLNL